MLNTLLIFSVKEGSLSMSISTDRMKGKSLALSQRILLSVYLSSCIVIATFSPTYVAAQSHFGEAPYPPPNRSDTTFIVDQFRGLDTGCTFRGGGPLVFEIAVTRFVGETNADGTLKNLKTLIDNNVVKSHAILTMPAFDVDIDTPVPPPPNPETPPINPEKDQVLFNGHHLGFLTGQNNTWYQNSFVVPIELIKFPARGSLGSTPTAAVNTITINIDTANATEAWCTSIDWAALTIQAMSPIILIHGNNSDPGFFDRRGFSSFLQFLKLPFDGCGDDPTRGGLCKNPIKLPTDDIPPNGLRLDSLIPPIVKSFGVDSVHLVAHSKGGLDAREYLASYQPAHDGDFKVLSLTTLSTPHNGSLLADILLQRTLYAGVSNKLNFVGFPEFTKLVSALVSLDKGKRSLATDRITQFNERNISDLPKDTIFNTVGADADGNCSGEVDRSPDEYGEIRAESHALAAVDAASTSLSRKFVNAMYKNLRDTAHFTVRLNRDAFRFGTPVIATLTAFPRRAPLGNDIEVALPSAHGLGAIDVASKANFIGASEDGKACVESPGGINIVDNRNHGSVAGAGVASTVVPWIVKIEQTIGDLK
jgi:pimeloyl-ACP methyl ester carboxylesterase